MAPQARSEATRQKILDAAIDLFSEVGYASATLGEIIERAGMTRTWCLIGCRNEESAL